MSALSATSVGYVNVSVTGVVNVWPGGPSRYVDWKPPGAVLVTGCIVIVTVEVRAPAGTSILSTPSADETCPPALPMTAETTDPVGVPGGVDAATPVFPGGSLGPSEPPPQLAAATRREDTHRK